MSIQAQQYYPVIIQIGARFIRAGFAGDATPILRTTTNAYDLSDAQLNIGAGHAIESVKTPMNDYFQGKFLWVYDLVDYDFAKLESLLERIIYNIYQSNLLVDAKKCKVLIIEPPFFPVPLKKTLTKVLLFHIHAQSLRFYPEPVLSCVSAGSNNGLVIDIGWSQTTVTPIYDLRMIYTDIKVTNRSGRLFHELVKENLDEIDGCAGAFDFELIEGLICDTFYCQSRDAANRHDTAEFQYGSLKISNRLRYNLIEEFMFEEDSSNLDNDNHPLIPMVIKTLQNSPIDLRKELSTKIIITGGLSKIPGLKTRILEEIEAKMDTSIESIVSLDAWEGASLYCSTALMSPSTTGSRRTDELFRDKYLNGESILTDWSDQLYTQQRAI